MQPANWAQQMFIWMPIRASVCWLKFKRIVISLLRGDRLDCAFALQTKLAYAPRLLIDDGQVCVTLSNGQMPRRSVIQSEKSKGSAEMSPQVDQNNEVGRHCRYLALFCCASVGLEVDWSICEIDARAIAVWSYRCRWTWIRGVQSTRALLGDNLKVEVEK